MKRRTFISTAIGAGLLANCGGGGSSQPRVDSIVVEKQKRKMTLYQGKEVFKTYDIGLGFAPQGHKRFEGDGKTPEGSYFIYTKNPRSEFYLSLGISYPNAQDVAFARQYGRSAGGQIFIHGESSNPAQMLRKDWTAGCIAVTNREITEIYQNVGVGTRIEIKP